MIDSILAACPGFLSAAAMVDSVSAACPGRCCCHLF